MKVVTVDLDMATDTDIQCMGTDTVIGGTMIIGVTTTMVGATAVEGSIMVAAMAVMRGTVVDGVVDMAVAVSRMVAVTVVEGIAADI